MRTSGRKTAILIRLAIGMEKGLAKSNGCINVDLFLDVTMSLAPSTESPNLTSNKRFKYRDLYGGAHGC